MLSARISSSLSAGYLDLGARADFATLHTLTPEPAACAPCVDTTRAYFLDGAR